MLEPGILFDNRYELIKLIGRGGFAEVWLVKDTLTGLDEALKIYAPGGGMDDDGLKVFSKELAVVHNLHHTNLLTPKILAQYDHQPYLVLSYCPNGSLKSHVGHCSEDEAWKIIEQVASGLAYLHKHKVVHQDIKPDNILIDANQDYMIADFGISLKAQTTLRKSMRIQADSGTMAYMAPERFSTEPHPIPANDIWSLGAMMFELVEGNVPFVPEMGGLAQMNNAQLPTMHAPVSMQLKQTIASLLSLNPENRPTAEQLSAAASKKEGIQPKEKTQPKKEPALPKKEPAQPKKETGRETQVINRQGTQPQPTKPIVKPVPKPQPVPKPPTKTDPSVGPSTKKGCIWSVAILAIVLICFAAIYMTDDSNKSFVEGGFVDLGLSSGTEWATSNEDYMYNFDDAYNTYSTRLPTIAQWQELKSECTWERTDTGYKVTGPNGNCIYLPFKGYFNCGGTYACEDTFGGYWSQTDSGNGTGWIFYIKPYYEMGEVVYKHCYSLSVRLVR